MGFDGDDTLNSVDGVRGNDILIGGRGFNDYISDDPERIIRD
jgi:hypothetical protein